MKIGDLLQLMRVHQWVKNGFVLAPLFFGAALLQGTDIVKALAAFLSFCFLSSAVYIFNDWRDIEADRQHAKKRNRPLPSGRVSVPTAMAALAVLVALALGVAALAGLPASFFVILATYAAINLGYSLGLKQVAVLELFLVSSGFVLRLIAGGVAINVSLSPWIIIATATVSLMLATAKRRGDLARGNDAQMRRKSLSGYNLGYLDSLLSALTGATLVVYLLFTVSPYAEARYGETVIITALPVAFGLARYLQLVKVHGDGDAPTDLLLKDKTLMAVLVVFMAMFGVLVYAK